MSIRSTCRSRGAPLISRFLRGLQLRNPSANIVNFSRLYSTLANTNSQTLDNCAKRNKLFVIAGASGECAKALIINAVEKNYQVRALTTSNLKLPKHIDPKVFRFVNVKTSDYQDPKAMTEILKREVADAHAGEIHGAVLIGGANPPKGLTLDQTNVTPLKTMSSAIEAVAKEKGSEKTGLVYLSSVAATHVKESDSYAASRDRADQWLVNQGNHEVAVSFRPGLILDDPQRTKSLISKHPYSIDQIVNAPLVTPIIGSGKQICETVMVQDLVDAVFNTLNASAERDIIHAVTRHQYTQLEIISLFAKAMGRAIKPFHVAPDVADVIGTHFPMGRLASYSAKVFKHRDNLLQNTPLCHKKFEEILGRDPISLEKVLLEGSEPLLTTKLPIGEHLVAILKKNLTDKTAREAFINMLSHHGVDILKGLIKAACQ